MRLHYKNDKMFMKIYMVYDLHLLPREQRQELLDVPLIIPLILLNFNHKPLLHLIMILAVLSTVAVILKIMFKNYLMKWIKSY